MIAYGISILPLVHELWGTYPQVTQPWNTYDVGTGGKFYDIHKYMRDMLVRGPPLGCFPDTTKSSLVVSLWNVQRAEVHFRGMGKRMVTVILSLGSFIGYQDSEKKWMA